MSAVDQLDIQFAGKSNPAADPEQLSEENRLYDTKTIGDIPEIDLDPIWRLTNGSITNTYNCP